MDSGYLYKGARTVPELTSVRCIYALDEAENVRSLHERQYSIDMAQYKVLSATSWPPCFLMWMFCWGLSYIAGTLPKDLGQCILLETIVLNKNFIGGEQPLHFISQALQQLLVLLAFFSGKRFETDVFTSRPFRRRSLGRHEPNAPRFAVTRGGLRT